MDVHLKNKKASVYAVGILLATVVITAFTIVLSKYVIDNFYVNFNAAVNATAEMTQAQTALQNNFMVFDYAIVIVIVILLLGLIFTSFMIPTHPVFMVINFVGIFVLVFLGMILNNAYGEFVTSDTVGNYSLFATAQQFPAVNWAVSYLPYIAAFAIFLLTIIVYTRSQGGGNY